MGKCKYKYWLTTCLRSRDMNAIGDACKCMSPIAFISKERKQVVIQFLNLHHHYWSNCCFTKGILLYSKTRLMFRVTYLLIRAYTTNEAWVFTVYIINNDRSKGNAWIWHASTSVHCLVSQVVFKFETSKNKHYSCDLFHVNVFCC